MEFIMLTRIGDKGSVVINMDNITVITPATYIGKGNKSIPCTRISIKNGFVDVEEQFDTVLTMLGCTNTNEEYIDRLAEKIQIQDEVAFPTMASAKKAIKEDPIGIIDWLLECLRQAQR